MFFLFLFSLRTEKVLSVTCEKLAFEVTVLPEIKRKYFAGKWSLKRSLCYFETLQI